MGSKGMEAVCLGDMYVCKFLRYSASPNYAER
jgi:hypothetical protein